MEKATEVKSPFAGVGERSPFGLSDFEVGRPAKLPERKTETTQVTPVNESPAQAQRNNPFEIYREHQPTQNQENLGQSRQDHQYSQMPAPMPTAAPNYAPQQQHSAPKPEFSQQSPQNYDPYLRDQREQQPTLERSDQRDYLNYQAAATPAPQHTRISSGTLKQLELRAIFGVNHELTREEIIQRARTLPGIRNVAIVGEEESHALSVLKSSIGRLGFGDAELLSLNASSGNVDFIHEGDSTLAVLHEGGYAPGVRETLMIVTRELGRAS